MEIATHGLPTKQGLTMAQMAALHKITIEPPDILAGEESPLKG